MKVPKFRIYMTPLTAIRPLQHSRESLMGTKKAHPEQSPQGRTGGNKTFSLKIK